MEPKHQVGQESKGVTNSSLPALDITNCWVSGVFGTAYACHARVSSVSLLVIGSKVVRPPCAGHAHRSTTDNRSLLRELLCHGLSLFHYPTLINTALSYEYGEDFLAIIPSPLIFKVTSDSPNDPRVYEVRRACHSDLDDSKIAVLTTTNITLVEAGFFQPLSLPWMRLPGVDG